MHIADKIRIFRAQNKLTQRDFAKMVGVSDASISQWENKKNRPTKKSRKRIEETLDNQKTPNSFIFSKLSNVIERKINEIPKSVSIPKIMEDVEQLRKEHPEYKVSFHVEI